MDEQEFIKNVKNPDVLKKALLNGHSTERHENKPLTTLLKRVLTYKSDAASSFFSNVDKNALIRDALVNNADEILEWLKDAIDGDKFNMNFSISDNGNCGTKDGYIGNGFYRDDMGFVEARKTNTMFLQLVSNNKNRKLGFNIKTAYPDLKQNFEPDGTIDSLKVLKETDSYQKAGITGKMFYEMILGENKYPNKDALIRYDFKSIKSDKSENSKKDEYILLKYGEDNEKEFLHGSISKDKIEVAKKDENGRHIDWIMGKADEKYIPLNNNKAIQKFKGYCPRMYELLDDIKGKLDTRLELENIRNNDAEILTVNEKPGHANEAMSDLESKTRPNITFDSMKEDKAKKDAENRDKQKEGTRTEEEKQRNTKEKDHQAPQNSIPSKPSGGGGNGGGPDDR